MMIRAKNYEKLSKFVKVTAKILSVPVFGTRCRVSVRWCLHYDTGSSNQSVQFSSVRYTLKTKCSQRLRVRRTRSGYIIPWTFPPPFLHRVEHSPFHLHHPPIYSVKRSQVNVYKVDSGRSVRVRSMG